MKYYYYIIILLTLSGCKKADLEKSLPQKMSFEGQINGHTVSLTEGGQNITVTREYTDCCANYIIGLEDRTNGYTSIRMWASQSPNGFSTDNGYREIIDNLFHIGRVNSGLLTPVYAEEGFFCDVSYEQSYYYQEQPDIEISQVIVSPNACTCNSESYWIEYKLKGDVISGTLVLKYDDPCCL